MNNTQRAIRILESIKKEYPAIFRSFELDKVLELILEPNAEPCKRDSTYELG